MASASSGGSGVSSGKVSASTPVRSQQSAPPMKPVRAPAFRVIPLSQETRYLNILVHGEFGIGKTTLAGSAYDVEAMRDVLIISAEGGNLSLIRDEIPEMDTVRVNSFGQLSKVESALRQYFLLWQQHDEGDEEAMPKLRRAYAQFCGISEEDVVEPKRWRTIIVDSLSEIEILHVYSLLGVSEATKLEDEFGDQGWDEYRKNLNKILLTVRRFRDLPAHVIMTCATTDREVNKKKIWRPALYGQLQGAVQGVFDVVGFYQSGTVKDDDGNDLTVRRLWVQPVGPFNAKCRFARFKGNYFDNPTMSKILEAVGLSGI